MPMYLNRVKQHPSLNILDLMESWQDDHPEDFISVEKACCYQIVQFDYPYINSRTGKVMRPDKQHLALILPSTTVIDGAEEGYVHVAKATSTSQISDAIPIQPSEVRGKRLRRTTYVKLDAVCSIEPGTKVEKKGVLIPSKGELINTAVEQFSGMREFTVYRKDGSSSARRKYVTPPKPEASASNSAEKGNGKPRNSLLRYRRSSRPLYEFAVNPNFIKAVIIELA